MAPVDQDVQRDMRRRGVPAGFEPSLLQQPPAPALYQSVPHDASTPDAKATRREQMYHNMKNHLERLRFNNLNVNAVTDLTEDNRRRWIAARDQVLLGRFDSDESYC